MDPTGSGAESGGTKAPTGAGHSGGRRIRSGAPAAQEAAGAPEPMKVVPGEAGKGVG